MSFLAFAALITRAQEVEPGEVIKIDANLISVPVIVSDRNGRYLPGLTRNDFTLFDDGRPRQIAFFDAAEEPLNVAILLDTSKSTTEVLDDIKSAAKQFIKELRPQDRALIVSFDYSVLHLSPLTSDRKQLERAIKNAKIGDLWGTVLYDAVYGVIDRDLRPITGRKAIILLTDGEDAGSRTPAFQLLDYAAEADTVIYSISYPSGFRAGQFFPRAPRRDPGIFGPRFPGRRRFPFVEQYGQQGPGGYPPQGRGGGRGGGGRRERRSEEADEFLTKLSAASGGRFYRSEVTDLKKTFDLIADELRYQYRLGFYPDPDAQAGVLHTLRVKVERPDTAVRARGFYRTGKAK
jgi:VWFA-related protein